jgi:hypothetical protein
MDTPIFLLNFAFAVLVRKQPKDQFSRSDAQSRGKYNHHR